MRNVSVLQTNVVHVPHERQERRPHKEFTTACIIHLISTEKKKKTVLKKKTHCQDQLSFPAMQVTSSHVSIWFDFLASYDEYTALVKFGNVASEHVKSAISVVQPQLSAAQQKPSAVQQNRVGALVTHHPAWMSHHTGGSRQGHPRYTGAQQWEGRGWPDQEISQSAAHRYTKCKSCLTGL